MAPLAQPRCGVSASTWDVLRGLQVDRRRLVVHFWADWCAPCGLVDDVLDQLRHAWEPSVCFARVEAESVPDAALHCDVQAVPLVVLYQDGQEKQRVQGADAHAIAKAVEALAQADAPADELAHTHVSTSDADDEASIHALCERLCRSHAVMVFLKGSPGAPKCKFSRKVVDALHACGISFGAYDVLCDDKVRRGLKKYANWSTYPQLYVHGELLGGADVVEQWHAQGTLQANVQERLKRAQLPPASVDPTATDASDGNEGAIRRRLDGLVQASDVMLFMKGTPESPQCGFSAKVVDALQAHEISFGHFDILVDEGVRQGLKQYAQWPTYPQLYVKGKLLGGCDIVLELQSNGLLVEEIHAML
mmetsp:Transcript_519/g.1873  ORF Transcript_519/g.1873 Transcript_519/m.1873 type:complete len:363 (+) Transcript_519:1511-2599(+)